MAWQAEAAAAAGALVLAACTALPAWQAPQPALPGGFNAVSPATPLPGDTGGIDHERPQRLVDGAPVAAEWWREFHSPALDTLVEEALRRHPDIDAAQAALAQAQADLEAARAQHYAPLVTAQAGASRQRVPSAVSATPYALTYNLFQASVGVSYNPDLSGSVRAALAGLGAQVDLQRYQLEAVRLTLGGNIATTAFREAGLRAQIESTSALLRFLDEQRELARARLRAGAATSAEVLSAEIAVDDTAASLPALDKALAQTRNQLAVYVGRSDSDQPLPQFTLADFELPADLPLSVPSTLARQRPDLRAAEAALQSANAAVGVAHANRFPALTLSAQGGPESLTLPGLLRAANLAWSAGANVAGTLFDGGALAQREASARAAYAQVEAQYRSTVLVALQNVVDALVALQHDARTVDAQRASVSSARATASLVEQQLELGAATRQQLLVARINALEAEVPLGPQRALRLADTAALYQALGGGWSNRQQDGEGGN